MNGTISILSLEDDSEFFNLLRGRLDADGLRANLEQVETRQDFLAALDRHEIDLILSDFQLPGFDGFEALAIAREKRPDLPFILLSGVLGEELAVDALHRGATDYVLKQRLARLVPTIRRAIGESQLRREQKIMAERLREAEKLASIGRLAASVAHEINNPLAGIKNSFRLVRGAIPPEHPYFEYVGLIEKEIDRAAWIVRQMFDLYHPQRESFKETAVEALCRHVVAVLEPVRQAANVNVRVCVPEEGFTFYLPENSVRQVLVNVVKNAIDASPQNAPIMITATRSPRGLLLMVEDQGAGIPEAVRPHVFEPFYTTKTGGNEAGMGLGLAIVWGLVSAINGTIDFTSEAGKGTVFRIEIPQETLETK